MSQAASGAVKIHRALISVYDKTGIADFARSLHELGIHIIASGGTAGAIDLAGIPVTETRELTGYRDILNHRVVTLHPTVHGGILAKRNDEDDLSDMSEFGILPIDLVVVGLYPFREMSKDPDNGLGDIIEAIDVGGPTLIMAAVKNMAYVGAVTNSKQYNTVIQELVLNDGHLSVNTRVHLALIAANAVSGFRIRNNSWLAENREGLIRLLEGDLTE
jgi:phosphoribosylaminoimidazolecarboxamide formyltransferase / IMP cyclohydrolase